MKNTFRSIPLFLVGILFSQTIEIGNTTLNTGGSGVTGTLTTNETYRFQHTVSIGEPIVGTIDYGSGSSTLGQFSYYNQRANLPTVTASEGDYPDQVKVEWSVDILQPPIQNGVKIFRNGELKAQFGFGVIEWVDENVFPGEVYLYEVQAQNRYGWGIVGEADGFVNPNGRITGKIQTSHQTPVYGVEVALDPYFGKTLEFDGDGDFIEVPDFPDDVFTDNTYTIEFWMNVQNYEGYAGHHGFPISKWHTSSSDDNTFYITTYGTFHSKGTSTGISEPPMQNEWHHLSYVMNNGTLSIYLDSLKVAEESGHYSNATEHSLRMGNHYNGYYNFDGHLDEIRIWNTVRDSAQIVDNMHRVVDGDSDGLVAEWRFDEGIGSKVFDITDASHDGHITGAMWSDENPDIHNSAFTDMNGNYSIRGIYYEPAGTEFTVTPQKVWHEFTPENKTVTLSTSSTASDGVDFMDNSQISVTGYVLFQGTSCSADSVEIMEIIFNEDGTNDTLSMQPPVFTDNDGHYRCEFEPGTEHTLFPQKYDHQFSPSHRETGVIVYPLANQNFTDLKHETLVVKIGGGHCELPLGEFEVTVSTQPSCYETTVTSDLAGNAVIYNLPARHFEVSVFSENPLYDFTGQQANLVEGSDTLKFIYYAPLQVELTSNSPSCGQFDHIVQQGEVDSLSLSVFEQYGNMKCYIDSYYVEINDELSDTTYSGNAAFEESRQSAPIYFTPRTPNLLGGGNHPYQKKLDVMVRDNNEREATAEFWAFIEGVKEAENSQFTTTTSEMPWFVLRKPPGDGSYTYFSEDMETCKNIRMTSTESTEHDVTSTLHLGPDVSVTVGFLVMTTVSLDITMDVGFGWEGRVTETETDESCMCFTRSENYYTSSDGLTGDDATVFVGGGLTMTFSPGFYIQTDGLCDVQIDTVLTSTIDGVHSTYMFTRHYIKTVLQPNLLLEWQELQDSTSLEGYHFWTDILQQDSIAVASAQIHEALNFGDGETVNNIVFDAGAGFEYSTTTSDYHSHETTVKVENSYEVFGELGLTLNGLGFSQAASTTWYDSEEESETASSEKTQTVGFVLDDDDPGDGFSVNVLRDTQWGMPVFQTIAGQSGCPWEPNTLHRQAVQLMIDGPIVAANILPDEMANFTIVAGNATETDEENPYEIRLLNSSNPYGAIVKIGGQVLGADAISYTIPAGQQQILSLTVERGPTEYDYEDLELILYSACEYELWGDTGIPIPEGLADTVAFSVHFIEPCGGVPEIAYPSNGWVGNANDSTVFFSIAGYNRHDPALSHILMEYQHVADGTMNNGNGNGEIDLPIINSKLPMGMENNSILPQGALAMTLDGWFIADTIFVDSLDADYYSWEWDVSFMDDGHYEVRAVVECIDGELNVSQSVTGQLDREPPEVFGEMHPTDGVLNADDEIKLVFEEAIDCDYLYPNQIHLYNESFGMDVAMDYDCYENEIVIVPDVQNMFIENCYLKLSIDELWDLQGNQTEQEIVFEFFVDQNPIHWNQNIISDVVYMGEDKTITTTLHNPGTASSPFVFSGQPWFIDQQTTALPWWIDINPSQGDLNPGGEFPVEMTISGMLNLGEHEEIFYAHTTDGDEPLKISVRSLCPPPVWDLDEQAYQYSMNLTCQVSVKDEISTDNYDFIGAFVNDECRGFAPIEHTLILSEPYDSTWTDDNGIEHTHIFVDTLMNKYLGFMTVHSDAQTNEDVNFRLWDASDCEEYYEIEQHLPFVSNSVYGNLETPLVLNATGAVAQFVTMEKGWTWFSVHLNHDDAWLDINHIFSHEDHFTSGDRIIHQSEFESYSESAGAWVPGMMRIDPREMYMAHLDTLTPVTFIGHEISPDSLEITLHPNWNWLGYPLRFNHSINEALQNLSPTDESVIKSETQFAEYMESIGLWVGSLQWMTPGHGYLYENTGDTLLFTYSGLDAEQGGGLARMLADNIAEPIESPWTCNTKEFRYNMPVIGKMENGQREMGENVVISAMVDDEVRGIAQPVYETALDDWRIYLMVHSNRANGETVKFRIYDAETGTEFFTNEIVSFDETRKAGSVANPIPLTKATAVIPGDFVMQQNHPNPFNPTTSIDFGIPLESEVSVVVYDMLGREVAILLNGNLKPGYHTVVWHGRDDHGKAVASGVYFIVLESGGAQVVRKMLLLK